MRFIRPFYISTVSLFLISFSAVSQIQQLSVQREATIDPNNPNLPAQRLGANDLVAITVYDSPELTRTVRIGADGTLHLPMLKRQIQAQGLMPGELETAIATALRAENLLIDPFVTVTVAQYHSRPISVAGAVKTPITFQAAGPITLLEALNRAGGLSLEAGSEILVSKPSLDVSGKRDLSLTHRISVRALIDDADPAVNYKLEGGEDIRVPEAGKIFVLGNVKKPGSYIVKGDTQTTVYKALAVAEGLTPFYAKTAYIYRKGDKGLKNEIAIDLKDIMERKSPDVPLVADDVLYVPDNAGRRMRMGALDRILTFGTTAGATALIYGGHP